MEEEAPSDLKEEEHLMEERDQPKEQAADLSQSHPMEEEALSHVNKEEEAAAVPSSQMNKDEQGDFSKVSKEVDLMEEEERDRSKEEQAADPSQSHPTEEEDGDLSTEEEDDDHEEEQDEEEDSWEAYLRSQRSRHTFAQYYRCRPMSLLGNDAAAGYDEGNRVVMPQSALERLSYVEVEYPMVFRIQNAATLQTSHVGVQEFVADEGFVHVPTHTMARLGLLPPHPHGGAGEDGDDGQLVLLTSTSLPKATSVKLQPHTSDFLRVNYPKELLEYNFGKYTCMTVGDTITVIEGDRRYLLDVVEAKPADAVSTIETDCEVDFLPPLDYKEPTTRESSVPMKVATRQRDDEDRTAVVGVRMDGKPVERPAPAKVATGQAKGRFSHVGVRMDGKPVEPASTVSAAGPLAKANNTKSALRFGAGTSMASAVKAGQKVDSGEKSKETGGFTGQKYSLKD